MRAGQLRHRFKLQEKYQENTYGVNSVTWRDEAEFWGSLMPIRGKEYFTNHQIQATLSHKITTRYLNGVSFTPNKRIVLASSTDRIFNIQGVVNPAERNISLELMVQEDVDG